MEIVVVSDSHGQSFRLTDLEKKYPHADLYLHCGDLEDDCRLFPKWIFVKGNNDYFADEKDMPKERVIRAGEHRIFMTHSHLFPYISRDRSMVARAKELGCDIVLYGHTHISDLRKVDGVVVCNPGSCWYPRDHKKPSYALFHLGKDHNDAKILFFED